MKIGDRVIITGMRYQDSSRLNYIGRIGIIVNMYSEDYTYGSFCGRMWELKTIDSGQQVFSFEADLKINNNTTNNMNIKEKFTLAFKGEPEKSFRKAGITNGDDFLTEDGQQVFLGFLLKKFGTDFKTDIVDGILKDIEEEKNK